MSICDSGNSALQSSLRSRICGVSFDGRVLLQALAQLGHAGRFERETDGVRVAAEADEDVVAAFERFEQMEAGDGAAGAVCFALLVAEHERRVARCARPRARRGCRARRGASRRHR